MSIKISIVSLIYKSTIFADAVYNSVHKYTPELTNGTAEFFFIANDAEPHVIHHLTRQKYPFYINNNKILSQQELFKLGYGTPEYINRVYKGWNAAICKSKGEIVVLINSDMMFSEGWLNNLINKVSDTTIVTSKIVERPFGHENMKHHPCLGAYVGDFGGSPRTFREEEFNQYVANVKQSNKTEPGSGIYMPCALLKQKALDVGLYPEGNLHDGNFLRIKAYGDQEFVRKLKTIGVNHISALDSIVYHFKEGEQRE